MPTLDFSYLLAASIKLQPASYTQKGDARQAAASFVCLKKASSSALISFFSVEHIPCGAPGMTFSVAPLMICTDRSIASVTSERQTPKQLDNSIGHFRISCRMGARFAAGAALTVLFAKVHAK